MMFLAWLSSATRINGGRHDVFGLAIVSSATRINGGRHDVSV